MFTLILFFFEREVQLVSLGSHLADVTWELSVIQNHILEKVMFEVNLDSFFHFERNRK